MHLGGVHHRLVVGLGQPQVEGGDGFRAHTILPGYIEAGLQFDMVNGKAGNFFHDSSLSVLVQNES